MQWMRTVAGAGFVILAVAGPARAQDEGLGEVASMGDGARTLLLIPCMSCRWRSWEPFMERNSSLYRMTAVTLAGFGGTAVPDTPMNGPTPAWRKAAVEALSALLDRADMDSVTVVGHSFGGEIAVLLAARRSDRVTRLVLLDSWPFSDRQWFQEDSAERVAQADRTVRTQTETLRTADAWQAFNAPPSYAAPDRRVAYHGWFMATPREVMLQYWRENSLLDLNPSLKALEMPVLDVKMISPAVADGDSARADRHDAWRRNGRPRRLQTIFLPQTRHFVMEERPAVLDSLMARFVEAREVCAGAAGRWLC